MEALPTWAWAAAGAAGALGVWLRMTTMALFTARGVASGENALAVVNLAGCFAIGILAVRLPPGPWRAVVVAGFLGGFTTFSSFAWMLVDLARRSDWTTASIQVLVQVAGGALAVSAGIALAVAYAGETPAGPP